MVARYFDLVWPEYERRVVVDNNGVVTGEKLQRRRRLSSFNVMEYLYIKKIFSFTNIFQVYQPLMLTVAILTWIAFFCILFELDWNGHMEPIICGIQFLELLYLFVPFLLYVNFRNLN
jgi:hypothetical protein